MATAVRRSIMNLSQKASFTAGMLESMATISEGSGWGGSSFSGAPGAIGTMSAENRSTLGNIGTALSAIGLLGGLGFAAAPVTAISIADKVAGFLGANPATPNPFAGYLSAGELQDISDYQGAFAAREAQAKNADIDAMNEAAKLDQTGYANVGVNPGGWGGLGSGTSAGEGFGGGYGGGGPGSGNTGGYGGNDAGAGMGGGGADWKRGGVSVAAHGPKHARYGEAGEETAIFIPKAMERPGRQGREREVLEALLETIARLSRGKTARGKGKG